MEVPTLLTLTTLRLSYTHPLLVRRKLWVLSSVIFLQNFANSTTYNIYLFITAELVKLNLVRKLESPLEKEWMRMPTERNLKRWKLQALSRKFMCAVHLSCKSTLTVHKTPYPTKKLNITFSEKSRLVNILLILINPSNLIKLLFH